MSIEMWIYLAGVLGMVRDWSVGISLLLITIMSLGGVILGFVVYVDGDDEASDRAAKPFKYSVTVVGLLIVFSILVPSKHTIYAITAVSLSKEVGLHKTAKKSLKLLDSKLDELITAKKER